MCRYTCPAREAARGFVAAAASADADDSFWLYYFQQVPSSPEASYGLEGACHGCEMAFVWRNPAELTGGAEEFGLSDTISSAWFNTAAHGNPRGTGPPALLCRRLCGMS